MAQLLPSAVRKPLGRAVSRSRAKLAVIRRYPKLRTSPALAIRYLLFDPELDNYTYDIANRGELAEFLATVFGVDRGKITAIIAELDGDDALRAEVETLHGRKPQWGRRMAWYAVTRLTKPKIIVETGVHDGLEA